MLNALTPALSQREREYKQHRVNTLHAKSDEGANPLVLG